MVGYTTLGTNDLPRALTFFESGTEEIEVFSETGR